jgi:hypothetical protein
LSITAWALVQTEFVPVKNTANLLQCISITAFRALDVISKSILDRMRITGVKAVILVDGAFLIPMKYLGQVKTELALSILFEKENLYTAESPVNCEFTALLQKDGVCLVFKYM